jgi:hypothetical protein
MPVIAALRMLRQEGQKLQARLNYIVRSSSKKKQANKKPEYPHSAL